MSTHLQIRLQNCLQTILDLEPDMEKFAIYDTFKDEMTALKKYLNELNTLSLSEDDVTRLEKATALFLQELSLPFIQAQNTGTNKRILQ